MAAASELAKNALVRSIPSIIVAAIGLYEAQIGNGNAAIGMYAVALLLLGL